MELAKSDAYKILSVLGCLVTEIPETDERRADLRAVDASSSYIVEVKHKLDDIELLREHSKRMANGEVVMRSEPLSRNNRIDAILKNAQDQLEQTPKSAGEFRLIWFHAGGIDRDLHWKRAFATFYGFVQLIAIDPPSNDKIDCFYFDFSAAWAMPQVDAMVLSDASGLQLCLNEFSNRSDDFARTDLCHKLSSGLVDPRELCAKGLIIALRSGVSRKDEAVVLKALYDQTGVRYTPLRPTQHSASAMINAGIVT